MHDRVYEIEGIEPPHYLAHFSKGHEYAHVVSVEQLAMLAQDRPYWRFHWSDGGVTEITDAAQAQAILSSLNLSTARRAI